MAKRTRPTIVTLVTKNPVPGEEEFEFFPFDLCVDALTEPIREVKVQTPITTLASPFRILPDIETDGETIED